jgi:hypothetical protein
MHAVDVESSFRRRKDRAQLRTREQSAIPGVSASNCSGTRHRGEHRLDSQLLTEQPLSLQGSLKGNTAMEVATNTVRDTLQRAYLLQNKLHYKMRDQPSPPGWDHSGYPKYCSLKVSLHYKFLNEQDLQRNLRFFKVPQASIESIRSKLAFKLFDEFTNILKGMYSMRFNGTTTDGDIPAGAPSDQDGPAPPLITSLSAWQPNKFIMKQMQGDLGSRERSY